MALVIYLIKIRSIFDNLYFIFFIILSVHTILDTHNSKLNLLWKNVLQRLVSCCFQICNSNNFANITLWAKWVFIVCIIRIKIKVLKYCKK